MGDPIGTNVDVFWEISANFQPNTAKVMSIWTSKVGQNLTAFKK